MSDEEGLNEVRKEFLDKWKEFAKEMDKEGPFFMGQEPSLIDFVVAPWAVSLRYQLADDSLLTGCTDASVGVRPFQGRPWDP